jgi:uncharacterized membrane protein
MAASETTAREPRATRSRARGRDPAADGWPGEMEGGERLARGLGWFSLALGTGALLAPRSLARLIGVGEHPALLRAIGARELVSGLGILSERRPAGWMRSRVAGDAMDLTLLGIGLRPGNPHRGRTIGATAAVAGVLALDLLASRQLGAGRARSAGTGVSRMPGGRLAFTKGILVNAAPERCYELWRDFANLPRFMRHLVEVRVEDERRSHWVARGPGGARVEWNAETTADVANTQIAWRSLPGSAIENEGSVGFEPGPAGRGTLVRVNLQYRPPAGAAGAVVARLFGEEPQIQIPEDLRRFKRLVETGEVPTTDGQPHGRRSALGRTFQRMPQP